MVSQITESPLQTKSREDTRNFKGYKWEMTVREAVSKLPLIKYEGNPINYYDWLNEHNRTHYDGNITLPNGEQITLEMKFRACKKVYHSWFMDCWLPREADIFVTNNTNVISYKDKRALDSQHKKLMSLSEFTVYLGKILRTILHPSKYLYFNRRLIDLNRIIVGLFNNLLGTIKQFFNKFRWLKVEFWQKSNETLFFQNKMCALFEIFEVRGKTIFRGCYWKGYGNG